MTGGTLDYDEMVGNRGIIIDDAGDMIKTYGQYEATVGDNVQIETDEGEMLSFRVMATVDWEDRLYGGYFIFVPEDLLHTIKTNTTNFNSLLAFNTGLEDISQTNEMVYEICGASPDLDIRGIVEAASFFKQGLKEYKKRIYAIAVFIGIFALINLSNTLMTSFVARQQELGVLRSVGLSDKQLAKMLRAEARCWLAVTVKSSLLPSTVKW